MTTTKNAPRYAVQSRDGYRYPFNSAGRRFTAAHEEALRLARGNRGARVVRVSSSRRAELEAANARAEKAERDAQRWRSVIATLPLSEEALGKVAWSARPEDHNGVVWEMADDELRDMYTADAVAVARSVMAALASDVAIDANARVPYDRNGGHGTRYWASLTAEDKALWLGDVRAAFAAQCKAAVGIESEMPEGMGTAETYTATARDLAAERARADRAEKAAVEHRTARIKCIAMRSREIEAHHRKRAALAERVNEAEARGAARLRERLDTLKLSDEELNRIFVAGEKKAYDETSRKGTPDHIAGIGTYYVIKRRVIADALVHAALRVAEGEGAAPVAPADPAPARTPQVEVGQRWRDPRDGEVMVTDRAYPDDGSWEMRSLIGGPRGWMPHDAAGWTRVDAPAEAAPRWADDLANLVVDSGHPAGEWERRLARAIVELRAAVDGGVK